jgi:alkylhydroperoxidase family enzyme
MAWIQTTDEGDAEGALAKLYKAAIGRSGSVAGIVKLHSNDPNTLRASMALYRATTTSEESPLPRGVREMIATVVSRTNDCFY